MRAAAPQVYLAGTLNHLLPPSKATQAMMLLKVKCRDVPRLSQIPRASSRQIFERCAKKPFAMPT